MFSSKSLVSALAFGGLMLAGQTASANVVNSSDNLIPGDPTVPNSFEKFEFSGGSFVGFGVATDNNQYAFLDKGGDASGGGMGIVHHIAWDDINALVPAVDGMVLRVSAWVLDTSDRPWSAQEFDGFKIEFYDDSVAFGSGALNGAGFVNDTEFGFGLGLASVDSTVTAGGDDVWIPVSFETQVTDALVGFSTLEEARFVYYTQDFRGAPDDVDGKLLFDNWAIEVFANQAAADASPNNPLGAPNPGGFDEVDLGGDINGDGFVGVDDLNIVLTTWNNGIPPASGSPTVPEPASLALLGLGGLAVLRRR